MTSHGFVDETGAGAAPAQSVLEAGTAALVDEFGLPQVKCFNANPLSESETISGSFDTVGNPWPGFDPTLFVAVTPGDLAVSRFVLTDVTGGDAFSRGVATEGDDDQSCDESCGLDPD